MLISAVSDAGKCRDPWVYFPGSDSCYLLNSTRMDHALGHETCRRHGANLPTIKSEAEQVFVSGKQRILLETGNRWHSLYVANHEYALL